MFVGSVSTGHLVSHTGRLLYCVKDRLIAIKYHFVTPTVIANPFTCPNPQLHMLHQPPHYHTNLTLNFYNPQHKSKVAADH